jgi:hypothetical protein
MDKAKATKANKYNLNATEVMLANLGVYTAMPMQMIKPAHIKSTAIGVVLKNHFDAKNATQPRLDAHMAYNAKKEHRKQMREAAQQLGNL